MPAVQFTIPYPPTVNTYWRARVITPRGKRPFPQFYVTPKGKRYRRDVEAAIVQRFGPLRPTAARLKVTITAVMPDRRVRDLSNLLKAAEDALTAALVWHDDNQIDDLRVIRGRVEKPGWLEVSLEKLVEPAKQKELSDADNASRDAPADEAARGGGGALVLDPPAH